MPENFAVGFEKIQNKKYVKNVGQLQRYTSNEGGLYCAYYERNLHTGENMKDIVKDFNSDRKKQNDHF